MVLTLSENIESLPQDVIALLACFSLGGAKTKVHTEEIAHKCFLLNKDSFSWKLEKFQKYPDMARVRKAIDRLKKESLVVGSYSYDLFKDGWKLSSKGIQEVDKYKDYLKLKKTKTEINQEDKKFIKKFLQNKLYKDFLNNKNNFDISIYDVSDLLQSNPSNTDHIRSKFFELKNLIEISREESFLNFLNKIQNKFNDILSEDLFQKQNMASNKKISNIK